MLADVKRRRLVLYLLCVVCIGVLTACSSAPGENDRRPTATPIATSIASPIVTPTATPIEATLAPETDQLRDGQAVLYWHDGDLWRSMTDGSGRQPLTQGRLFAEWFVGPERDPWWFGGFPPQPFVSPDGRWLVASVDGRKFAVVDLTASEPPRDFPSTAMFFSWSPDAEYIAYGRDKINILDVAAGELLEVSERRPGDVTDIVWSPDGQGIAYACCFTPDERQAGDELGDIYHYRLASATAEKVGETWRGLASGTPGICWVNGRPVPADEASDRSQCSPERFLPRADSADGQWRAELGGYLPDENAFSEILVTKAGDDQEGRRLDLGNDAPALDLRRVFWSAAGDALLLGSDWPRAAIYHWDLGQEEALAPIIEDGVLMGVLPQWAKPPSSR